MSNYRRCYLILYFLWACYVFLVLRESVSLVSLTRDIASDISTLCKSTLWNECSLIILTSCFRCFEIMFCFYISLVYFFIHIIIIIKKSTDAFYLWALKISSKCLCSKISCKGWTSGNKAKLITIIDNLNKLIQ